LELADPDLFYELQDWSLLDFPAELSEQEFAVRDESHTFELDLLGRKLAVSYAKPEEQLALDIDVEEWTEKRLARALDRILATPRIPQLELFSWCLQHVVFLTNERQVSRSALWRAKFVLARAIKAKLERIGENEARKTYQQNLFATDAPVGVRFNSKIRFVDGIYDGQPLYKGAFRFKKHYLDSVPAFDGGEGGEEFQCALAIESNPHVKHWVRNVARHDGSFRLPLAQSWTYPDFVAELNDGRFLVVEYKGDHLLNEPSTKEKKLIGELWEEQMKGQGLYLMVVKSKNGLDMRAQIAAKLS